ncbi:bifunctional riboflavin kinase/FAD synthetase [Acidipropionibacterium jensenii]|uniref:bifunctional riboflavin kinase/FAD synthetase n=1 Tax=Acidipropionibacterium jensenii TaxID=1749 RepID=UPI000BC2EA5A|nr:bifunctional riboflavin kinase/FAD synthetase [Acidipropionibacterium jensenii]AZZ42443.1 bifunctional riboflavin kinase/FAD synthetase [Acidipropionibacterium jensenii]MDN5977939.1 bifunctional riboflavin kinase/FAD synthetase [Acidipropionibacterium jensenii]MDN5996868.1 bifunctional riboflavin kinase/FAD synthetase [Acidipropionibacterium jensenii]MDN6427856.1 bifunctional riboflavin kinase/FAD synthetase [Acidipropionibacterium jensenii]MDN6441634.1 bifunctional riboflavin kinase/FAD sy
MRNPAPNPVQSTVVIGNFDGVHRGHRAVLERARALDPDLPLVVVTFWPHPVSVLTPGREPLLLCSLERRIELLEQAGASQVRVVRFTRELAGWSPELFVERVLNPLNPRHVVVGRNFRFGHRAAGTPQTLAQIGAGRFDVNSLDLVHVEGSSTSSTLIRAAVAEGKVRQAARHLGRNFEVQGVVVMGDQRGRELGFPTANLVLTAAYAVPADGVYAGWLVPATGPEAGRHLPAAISVGSNPTFDGVEQRVETYVLDRTDLDLYGVDITVEFVDRLRGQVKFSGIDPLIAQMSTDVEATRRVLDLADGE